MGEGSLEHNPREHLLHMKDEGQGRRQSRGQGGQQNGGKRPGGQFDAGKGDLLYGALERG